MAAQPPGNRAILLTMFGTSVETGLPALTNIMERVRSWFQHIPVHIAFTSSTVRRIWRERGADPDYRDVHPEVGEEIFGIRSSSGVLAELRQKGVDSLVIQPVRMAPLMEGKAGTECPADGFSETVGDWQGIFRKIAVGRPALGSLGGEYPRGNDIAEVAASLQADIDLARRHQAALFYMGHGNKHSTTHFIYDELIAAMRRHYPDVITVMRMVEGNDHFPAIAEELNNNRIAKVVLKPFMIVAGDHVRKEMVGDRPDTLQKMLEKGGITVYPVLQGLGENDSFGDIFARRAAHAAMDAGIELE